MAGGSQPPKFLSTHPSNESRIADLKEYSAKVMPLYQAAKGGSASAGK
jgi:predicted Zn-dependent protease